MKKHLAYSKAVSGCALGACGFLSHRSKGPITWHFPMASRWVRLQYFLPQPLLSKTCFRIKTEPLPGVSLISRSVSHNDDQEPSANGRWLLLYNQQFFPCKLWAISPLLLSQGYPPAGQQGLSESSASHTRSALPIFSARLCVGSQRTETGSSSQRGPWTPL